MTDSAAFDVSSQSGLARAVDAGGGAFSMLTVLWFWSVQFVINLFFSDAYLFVVIDLCFDAYTAVLWSFLSVFWCLPVLRFCCLVLRICFCDACHMYSFTWFSFHYYDWLCSFAHAFLLIVVFASLFVCCHWLCFLFCTAFTELFRPTPLGRNKLLFVICDFKSVPVAKDFLLRYYIWCFWHISVSWFQSIGLVKQTLLVAGCFC